MLFRHNVRKSTDKDTEKSINIKTAELAKADHRIAELDNIIKRIYEDNLSYGRIYILLVKRFYNRIYYLF